MKTPNSRKRPFDLYEIRQIIILMELTYKETGMFKATKDLYDKLITMKLSIQKENNDEIEKIRIKYLK